MYLPHESYNEKSKETANLYNAIQKLIAGLKKGGVHGLSGGTEQVATFAAWEAIKEFRQYWNLLSAEQQTLARQVKNLIKH